MATSSAWPSNLFDCKKYINPIYMQFSGKQSNSIERHCLNVPNIVRFSYMSWQTNVFSKFSVNSKYILSKKRERERRKKRERDRGIR